MKAWRSVLRRPRVAPPDESIDRGASGNDPIERFFEDRSAVLSGRRPSRAELCYVSGRDPRLWADDRLFLDLIASLQDQLELSPDRRLLEVGCAAGFLASGLAPVVGAYVGVDLSARALGLARSLALPGAEFVRGNGTALPLGDSTFDAVVAYDVLTNIGDPDVVVRLVTEMARVVKPGGRLLVGSLADEARREEFVAVAGELSRTLDRRFGAPPQPPRPDTAAISCYYFRREDFLRIGDSLGLSNRIADIHGQNPYRGYRFNVIWSKPVPQGDRL